MKFVIQRVIESNVKIDNKIVGSINKGFVVLIGIENFDTKEIADKMIEKMINLRIFEDSNNKTNLSLFDVNGEILLISQFTLCADCKKGNRPSFINAGEKNIAKNLYEYIINKCENYKNLRVEKGVFGADMKVSLINDGPFTIILESSKL